MIGSLTLSIILAFSAGSVSLAPAGLPRECILRNGIYPGQHCLFFDGFESGDLTAWSLVCKGRRCKEVRRCPGGAKKPKAPLAQPKAPAVPSPAFPCSRGVDLLDREEVKRCSASAVGWADGLAYVRSEWRTGS